MHILLKLLGGLLALFSIGLALICLSILLEEGSENRVVYAGLIAILAGTTVFGIRLVRSGKQRQGEQAEKAILQLAAAGGGETTAAAVALGTNLTLDEAKALLDRLCQQGSAQPHVDDQGTMVYLFPGLTSTEAN